MVKNKENLKSRCSEDLIGERIKKARLNSKFTGTDLAKKLGISRSTLNNYEKGTHKLDAKMMRKLCEILIVSPNWLVFGVENVKQSKFPKSRLFDPDNTGEMNVIAMRFSLIVGLLDRNDRDAFLSLIASLVEAQMGTKSLQKFIDYLDLFDVDEITESFEPSVNSLVDDINEKMKNKLEKKAGADLDE